MSSVFYEFDEVDEFSASAIGEPGSRVFYLSARHGRQRVTVRCEKLQVKAISTWLRNVLNDLPPSENRPMLGQPDLGVAPDHAFVLGPIGLGYDRVNDRLLVQLEELIDSRHRSRRRRGRRRAPPPSRNRATAATSASTSPVARPTPSAITPIVSSPPAGRRASGAVTRSIRKATRARA